MCRQAGMWEKNMKSSWHEKFFSCFIVQTIPKQQQELTIWLRASKATKSHFYLLFSHMGSQLKIYIFIKIYLLCVPTNKSKYFNWQWKNSQWGTKVMYFHKLQFLHFHPLKCVFVRSLELKIHEPWQQCIFFRAVDSETSNNNVSHSLPLSLIVTSYWRQPIEN